MLFDEIVLHSSTFLKKRKYLSKNKKQMDGQNVILFRWKFHTSEVHTGKKRDRFKVDVQ